MKDGDLHVNGILEEFYQWVGISTVVRAVVFILGNLKFQREGSGLGLRKGWWESPHLHVNWGHDAVNGVRAADSEPEVAVSSNRASAPCLYIPNGH